jgi:iron complex outermembrane receptor protein
LMYSPMEQLQLEAFVNNLFDKTYIAVQVQESSSAAGGYMYGAPRQWGGRITYKF